MYDRLKKSSIGHKGLSKDVKTKLTSRVNSEKSPSKQSSPNNGQKYTDHTTAIAGVDSQVQVPARKANSVINIDIQAEEERDIRVLSKRSNKSQNTITASFKDLFQTGYSFLSNSKPDDEKEEVLKTEKLKEEEERLLKQEEEEEIIRQQEEAYEEDDDDADDDVHLAGVCAIMSDCSVICILNNKAMYRRLYLFVKTINSCIININKK